MSTKPNDLELEYIHQIARGSSKIQALIQAKNTQKLELENKQFINHKKPSPTPRPQGEVPYRKNYSKQIMDDKALMANIDKNAIKYDRQIKKELVDIVKHSDHDPIRSIVRETPPKDLAVLSEKGVEIYKQVKQEEQKEKQESIKFNFDDLNQFDGKFMYLDFLENSKDIEVDKGPSTSDIFE